MMQRVDEWKIGREPPDRECRGRVDVHQIDLELGGFLQRPGYVLDIRQQVGRPLRLRVKRAELGRRARVGGREEDDLVAPRHEAFDEVRDDQLGAAVIAWGSRQKRGGNDGNAHARFTC